MTELKFDHNRRLKKLRLGFEARGLDSYLVNRKERIFYLTGYGKEDGYLLITRDKAFLITDARFKQEAKDQKFNFEPIISRYKIRELKRLVSKLKINSLGFEEYYLSFAVYAKLRSLLNRTNLKPGQKALDDLMVIKDNQEIKAIREAVKICGKAFQFFKKVEKAGRTERDLSVALKHFILKESADLADFDLMVLSDERTSMPHALPSNKKINKNSNLLIDLGAKIYGYNSDLTRIFHLSKMSKRYKEILKIVKEAQSRAIEAVKPKVKISTIDKIVRNFFKKEALEDYFVHATGHGVGLSIHEKPSLASDNRAHLRAGMVFTVEPAIYLPGEFGVRLEDMVLVTKNGYEVLSGDITQ
jgi:Xaa-Pro aminopeptidase